MCKNLKILMVGVLAAFFVPWGCNSDESDTLLSPNALDVKNLISAQEAKNAYFELKNQLSSTTTKRSVNPLRLNIDWETTFDNVLTPHDGRDNAFFSEFVNNPRVSSKIIFFDRKDKPIHARIITWFRINENMDWDDYSGKLFVSDIQGKILDLYEIQNGLASKRYIVNRDLYIQNINFQVTEKDSYLKNGENEDDNCADDWNDAAGPDATSEMCLGAVEITHRPQTMNIAPRDYDFDISVFTGGGGSGCQSNCNDDTDGEQENEDENPCDKIKEQLEDEEYKSKVEAIRKKMEENHINNITENFEHSFYELSNGTTTDVFTTPGRHSAPVPANAIGLVHSHPVAANSSMFSGTDLYLFIRQLKSQCTRANKVYSNLILERHSYSLRFNGSNPCDINLNNYSMDKLNDIF